MSVKVDRTPADGFGTGLTRPAGEFGAERGGTSSAPSSAPGFDDAHPILLVERVNPNRVTFFIYKARNYLMNVNDGLT